MIAKTALACWELPLCKHHLVLFLGGGYRLQLSSVSVTTCFLFAALEQKNRRNKAIDKTMVPTSVTCVLSSLKGTEGFVSPFASECPAHLCLLVICRSGLKEVLYRPCVLAHTCSPCQRLLGMPLISNIGKQLNIKRLTCATWVLCFYTLFACVLPFLS